MILGAPAKVLRDLTPQEIQGIETSAAIYVGQAGRYAKGLKPV
jgi:carbonic anhydrase/acetyltransferase-like protein (isoleucine patch superfamily)